MDISWQRAQVWERDWWGTCVNTYGEEEKQLLYANRMGLQASHDGKSPYNFDLDGISVIDIGGGPCSLLLKCHNVEGYVLDPIDFPQWVMERYAAAGIKIIQSRGEELDTMLEFQEAWIYNTLQHVEDPKRVIENAQKAARLIRLFEWIDMAASRTHPQELTEKKLNFWLHGEGKVEVIHQNECFGKAYYGIFPS